MDKGKAYLTRKSNGDKIEISREGLIIGKSNKADYVITGNSAVSRTHARVFFKNDKYYVEDLQSLNHTYIDGRQIKNATELNTGAILKLADEQFIFYMDFINTETSKLINNDGLTEIVFDDDDPLGIIGDSTCLSEEYMANIDNAEKEHLVVKEAQTNSIESDLAIESKSDFNNSNDVDPEESFDEGNYDDEPKQMKIQVDIDEQIESLEPEEHELVMQLFEKLGKESYCMATGLSGYRPENTVDEIKEILSPDPNICKQCKASICPEHNFCPNCGAKLK